MAIIMIILVVRDSRKTKETQDLRKSVSMELKRESLENLKNHAFKIVFFLNYCIASSSSSTLVTGISNQGCPISSNPRDKACLLYTSPSPRD